MYKGKADIGSNEIIVPGLPFVTLNVSSNITESQQTQAFLFLSIEESSLIYKNQQDSLVSRVELRTEISSNENKPILSDQYQFLLGKSSDNKYYDQKTKYLKITYNVPPGNHRVKVTITDLHSGKKTTRQQEITIPDPLSSQINISQIRFYKKTAEDEPFVAVNGYDVNMDYDSLKFSFQLFNGKPKNSVEIESRLLRFKADLKPARSMSGRQHRSSSLERKGLDYTNYEVIRSTKRTLDNKGSVTVENFFTRLPRGNYRFEVIVKHNEKNNMYEVRDFAVKSQNYPNIKSPIELARPLYYLLNEKEYNEILAISDPDSLKAAVDEFWLSNLNNSAEAKEIIKMYYERVVQANQQFSNFKEGWKTDPGMIYILFGPPSYVDEGFGEMSWFYDFDTGTENQGFYFKDPRYGNIKFPFNNFQLKRSADFFGLQYKQIQSWIDGSIIYLSQ
ncbi:GWxTD domain-containing protein [Gracilimonas sp. Q87]|uniref:GWxTD domain-containing protein n=1 Tax=Gracilimonas sp. Q87 TaxID=3384766 RepID=UPI003983FBAF